MNAKPWVAPAMKNMFGAIPMVSLAMIAAISRAQVIISISAKVPKMDLGVPFILQAYCRKSRKRGASKTSCLSGEIAFVLTFVS
jgi:hypothetical protein